MGNKHAGIAEDNGGKKKGMNRKEGVFGCGLNNSVQTREGGN